MEDVGHTHARETSLGQFEITTEVYSGPLDLLIDLIERRKLLINDISLATVTDDYMRHVAMMEQNPLKETAEFVVLASTLLLIKSKSLLPILDLTEEEEESVEELEQRLRLYQIYRNAGKILENIFGKRMSYERRYIPALQPLFITDRYTETEALAEAIGEVMERLPKKVTKPKVNVRKVVSLEEMIHRIQERIERQLSFKFKDFTGDSKEKTTIIVGFLAVLEMVKQGTVLVRQTALFHDIEIEKDGSGAPKYM